MATQVQIWNLAISHVRGQPVGAKNEDSLAARVCGQFYNTCKEMTLSEAPWKFATRWDTLPQLTESPEGWKYSYQLPADFLRVWEVRGGPGKPLPGIVTTDLKDIPYDVVLNSDQDHYHLVTDIGEAEARVTHDVDEGLFPSYFVMALSHLLAVYIAVPLSGIETGGTTRDKNYAMYQRTLAGSRGADSSHQNIEYRSRYVDVRWGHGPDF